ncbi:RecX family transcriptional regulator [Flavobacterium litorale]|uniref:Regulatory protein RecX n=2 Tax=Flavobacterium litorale TaxID=2856519 RepID=A0ABX8V9E6_9FLAO|nr:RecX family transcriptional regulator [Flavobacterium litorale]
MQKLRSLNMIPEAIDVIIGHLITNNYLNEERFARSFARGRFRIKHWGKIRIVRELKARHISAYNIKAALQEIDDDEYLTAFNDLAEKQWNSIRESNLLKKKKKLHDFLMRKGFENQLIYDKIAALTNN